MISHEGSQNLNALGVPGVYVSIRRPRARALNGVATNVMGIIGSASWGPVNVPTTVDVIGYQNTFGPVVAREHDAGTAVAVAAGQGANAFVVVRVAGAGQAAATIAVAASAGPSGATLTAKYPGTVGNDISIRFADGSRANTVRAVISSAKLNAVEEFDNLSNVVADFWPALIAAINTGAGARAPSALVVASAGGTPTALPVLTSTAQTLTGGLDGTVADADLIGTDGASRTGMYQLRESGAAVGVLADIDATGLANMDAFGKEEGMVMYAAGPAGQSVATAKTAKASIDSAWLAYFLGDHLFWRDGQNGTTRLVSPAFVAAGKRVALSPEQSALNKPLANILGSQKSGLVAGSSVQYSRAEKQDLFKNGIDVIAAPSVGGNYWSVQGGINTSTSADMNGDNYAMVMDYIAKTVDAGMGQAVGAVINPDELRKVATTIDTFLGNCVSAGILAALEDGSMPYVVVCNGTNNPQSRTSLGYLQVDVQVQFQAITRYLTISVEGGQTVVLVR